MFSVFVLAAMNTYCGSGNEHSSLDAGVDASPVPDSSQSCAQNSDCQGPELCYFLISEGCSAKGTCLEPPFTGACKAPTFCACDGTSVVACAPRGYSPRPVASQTLCDAGMPKDGSTSD
jgi:hypothetical protein